MLGRMHAYEYPDHVAVVAVSDERERFLQHRRRVERIMHSAAHQRTPTQRCRTTTPERSRHGTAALALKFAQLERHWEETSSGAAGSTTTPTAHRGRRRSPSPSTSRSGRCLSSATAAGRTSPLQHSAPPPTATSAPAVAPSQSPYHDFHQRLLSACARSPGAIPPQRKLLDMGAVSCGIAVECLASVPRGDDPASRVRTPKRLECGGNLSEASPIAARPPRFCGECGVAVPQVAKRVPKFCGECGAALLGGSSLPER